jgi:flavin-dependent dehydrogenase
MPQHDVVIIGGGPAGCAAARLLASWGHSVLVLFRNTGVAGTLAESVPPSCRKLFAVIGMLDRIDAAGFYRSTGNTVCWQDEAPRRELFAGGATGYQVERVAFDALMRESAAASGATVREMAVREVRADAGEATVSLGDGSEARGRFVLDCSGRAGVIARRGWRVELKGFPRTVALVGVWTRAAGFPEIEPTHTLVESYGDGWCWSVPLSAQIRYVTAMVDPRRTDIARGKSSAEVYRAELGKTRHVAALVADATQESGPWGCDSSVYVANRYAEAPLLLVGDAASFIDPLSSYGIKKALASAWLAAVAVHTALGNESMTPSALEFFSARETEMASVLIEATRRHFGDAAARHPNPFWTDRAGIEDLPVTADPDTRLLRDDERVRRAFAALKESDGIALGPAPGLRLEPRPLVRGHEIVLEDRLFSDAMPNGVRFLRDVDLAGLLRIAPAHADVPALFDAYNRQFPPVALPDFLGALSVMLAFGMLENQA